MSNANWSIWVKNAAFILLIIAAGVYLYKELKPKSSVEMFNDALVQDQKEAGERLLDARKAKEKFKDSVSRMKSAETIFKNNHKKNPDYRYVRDSLKKVGDDEYARLKTESVKNKLEGKSYMDEDSILLLAGEVYIKAVEDFNDTHGYK